MRTRGTTVLLFAFLAVLLVIADRAPLHLDGRNPTPPVASDFYRQYYGVLDGSSGGPYVYRPLVPWVTEFAHYLLPAAREIDIDAVLKFLILVLVQAAFFRTQRRFFPPWVALAGVLWMDVLIGYSLAYVLGPASGETTDILNLLVFVVALDLMLDGKTLTLGVLLLLGILNRETPLILLPLVFVIDRSQGRGAVRPVLLACASGAMYVGIRLTIHAAGGRWFSTEGLGANIPGLEPGMEAHALQSVFHVVVLLGPLFVLAVAGFRGKPLIFRGSIVIAAVFVLVHFIVATVIESRLWLPLFPLLIPPSLETLSDRFARPDPP